jgi:2-desacetyl-2-hydroxyethyl bacteriochlorophyllide A dehydrogenase
MKALVIGNDKLELELQSSSIPISTKGQVIIKVDSAGICGTDLHFYTQKRKLPTNNSIILGHEFAGTIYSLHNDDADQSKVKVGDRVVVNMLVGCNHCENCNKDYKIACPKSDRIGITVNGGFAEYAIVPITNIYKLPDSLDFKRAIFADPLSCAYKGISKITSPKISNVLILGGGIIGFFSMQLIMKKYSPNRIVVIDRHDKRLDEFRKQGVLCFHGFEEMDIYNADFDLVIDACGNGQLLTNCINYLSQRSIILLMGLHLNTVRLDLMQLLQKEVEVISSLMYSSADFIKAIELLSSGLIQIDDTAIGIFKIEDYKAAFEEALQKELLKIILQID